MADSFLARITPVSPEGPVDPGYGQGGSERPAHPIVIPPLPGIWPPPGQVAPPIFIPPGGVAVPPIYIDATPEHPINLPVGIWPPLPPEIGGGPVIPPGSPPSVGGGPMPPTGGGGNKTALLVAVVGLSKGDVWSGYRWYVYEKPPEKPEAGPKR